jgi:hypothetical protein
MFVNEIDKVVIGGGLYDLCIYFPKRGLTKFKNDRTITYKPADSDCVVVSRWLHQVVRAARLALGGLSGARPLKNKDCWMLCGQTKALTRLRR